MCPLVLCGTFELENIWSKVINIIALPVGGYNDTVMLAVQGAPFKFRRLAVFFSPIQHHSLSSGPRQSHVISVIGLFDPDFREANPVAMQ